MSITGLTESGILAFLAAPDGDPCDVSFLPQGVPGGSPDQGMHGVIDWSQEAPERQDIEG